MKVIVPFAKLHDAVPKALQSQGITAQYIDTSNSDFAYFELLQNLWEKQETFIIVEGDIIAWPGSIKGLFECAEIWCGNPYAIFNKYIGCLGFSKFDIKLIEKVPNLFNIIKHSPDILFTKASMNDPPESWPSSGIWVSPTNWRRLDGIINLILWNLGFQRHLHYPPVTHLHNEIHNPNREIDEISEKKEYENSSPFLLL